MYIIKLNKSDGFQLGQTFFLSSIGVDAFSGHVHEVADVLPGLLMV
jgi:hypothetical protein